MRVVILAFLIFVCILRLNSQPAMSQMTQAEKAAISLYTQSQERHSRLFNGREYIAYSPLKDEHPYLNSDWEEGTLAYDGQTYQHLLLLYDVSKDELVTKYFNDDDIQLVKEKVSSFSIGKRNFVHIKEGTLAPAFYEIFYDGEIKVLSKFEKKLIETAVGLELKKEFEERTRWYFSVHKKVFAIKNKSSVYNIFPDHRTELKRFIHDNKLSFRENMSSDLTVIARFCEKFL